MRHSSKDIDRYLSEGLAPGDEAKLRDHLRACDDCRAYYDRQVTLLRALSGNPDSPTPRELERQESLALQAAGLAQPRKSGEPEPGRLDWPLWRRLPALAGAALLVVLLAASLGFFLSDLSRTPVARLTKAVAATLDGAAVDPQASPLPLVYDGQRLEVDQNGIAELSLRRGGSVRVFPDTVLLFKHSGSRLDLGIGKVWCLIEPSRGPFAVRTDLAEARVVGTSFVVERSGADSTQVRVMEGRVEVSQLKTQKSVQVQGGWKTQVARGEPPDPPSRYQSSSDRSEWDRKVDELWRDIKRAFQKVKNFFEGR